MEAIESTTEADIEKLEKEFTGARDRLLEAKRNLKPLEVKDYELTGSLGEKVLLSQLFGDRSELMVIHNMGKKCVYCTLWADGLNGLVKHLENRAGFVVMTPDDPETQSKFARDRGWTFKMYSTEGSQFTHDMGYEPEPKVHWPGVSFFRKDADGKIFRTAKDTFGPGDLYCSVWHLLDLLPNGQNDWEPKYHYV